MEVFRTGKAKDWPEWTPRYPNTSPGPGDVYILGFGKSQRLFLLLLFYADFSIPFSDERLSPTQRSP